MAIRREAKTKESAYKWRVAGLCFLMVFTVLGFCSSSRGIYISAITSALSISRSAFSISDSCRYLTTSIVNIFFVTFMNRFGAKKLIATGFLSLIISTLLYSVATNVYVFYLGGIFLGLGLSWTTTTMVGAVIGKFFQENRGTVIGTILAANGIGAAVSMQIITPIIYQQNTPFGYRQAYFFVALILLIAGTIILLFFKDMPNECTAISRKKAKSGTWTGLSFRAVLKKPYFYGAVFCIFVTGMILQGISGVSAPLLRDAGLPDGYIATVLSIHALALTVFKVLIGVVYDKSGIRITTNICFITAIAVMILLANITNSRMGLIMAMAYGILSSLALPLETIMIPIFAGDLFGEKSYHQILGIFTSANTAGFALGAPLANLCFDLTGTYHIAIFIACGAMLAATAVMQCVISASKRERRNQALQDSVHVA